MRGWLLGPLDGYPLNCLSFHEISIQVRLLQSALQVTALDGEVEGDVVTLRRGARDLLQGTVSSMREGAEQVFRAHVIPHTLLERVEVFPLRAPRPTTFVVRNLDAFPPDR